MDNSTTSNSSTSPVLRVEKLAVDFSLPGGVVSALRNVSFTIPRARTVALVGESGSGKSVTAQAILGILPSNARIANGAMYFAGNDGNTIDLAQVDADSDHYREIRGGQISIIFQEPMVSLSPLHTVGDQVSEALFLHRDISRTKGMDLTQQMLAMVGFPDPERALRSYPFELSGGLRQRAMIAMALVCRPSLLIADEPTTALDVTIQAQILKLISDLQAELSMSVLLITHDLGVVANVADEVVVIYHGEILEAGPVQDIFEDPRHPYLVALLKAVPRFDMQADERLTPIREIEMDLSSISDTQQSAGLDVNPTHLRIRGLNKSFQVRSGGWFKTRSKTIKAVSDVNLDIVRGETLGLVGESGCGKTTLSKLLMRALSPDSGSITFFDANQSIDVLALQDDALFEFRTKMQFIFQDPFSSLSPRMTVLDIIREPFVIHQSLDPEQQIDRTRELMRLVGLDPRFLNRYPHSFSGGQRQRIGIARALALSPQILLCDEPVSALDVSIQAQILNLLKDLQQEIGLSYFFISHNLAVVDYIADVIAVMCRGMIVEIAPREALFQSPQHPYTKALLKAVPSTDLNRPLDFEALIDNRYSDPESWPHPYALAAEDAGHLIDVSARQQVRFATTHAG